jgi:hypothetical protein
LQDRWQDDLRVATRRNRAAQGESSDPVDAETTETIAQVLARLVNLASQFVAVEECSCLEMQERLEEYQVGTCTTNGEVLVGTTKPDHAMSHTRSPVCQCGFMATVSS